MAKQPKQKKSRPYSRELENFVGSVNADIYLEVEREAEALNKALSKRNGRGKSGRPSKDVATIPEAREEILRLLTRCRESSVPPPYALIEALDCAWPPAEKSTTAHHRSAQMRKAAEKEAEHFLCAGLEASVSALSKASGTDRKTIRDWRENSPEFKQLVLDAIAAKVAARLP